MMDANGLAHLGSKIADVPSVSHFVEKFVETCWGSEINLGLSQTTFDRRIQKPTAESLQALGQILHDFGDQLSSNDVVRVTIILLNTIKNPNLCQSNAPASFQDADCQLKTINADCQRKTVDLETQRLVFNALANLLAQSMSLISKETWLHVVKTMGDALELLTSHGELVVDWNYSRLYFGVLRCVQLALSDAKGPLGEYVGGLVTSLLRFFGYGLGVSHFMVRSSPRSDAAISEAQRRDVPLTKAVYKPPHLRQISNKRMSQKSENSSKSHHASTFEAERRVFQSDSEQSDSDGSIGNQDRFKCSKARALAISSIQALARADPKSLHAHWILLFPTHDIMNTRRLQNSLLKSLLYDPILKVRMAAAATISLMLEGPSRAFIRMAEFRDIGKTGSFMTLSFSLGQVLLQLQKGLTHLAVNETNSGLLVASLKALSLFVGAAPFSRLPNDLLPNIIQAVQKRMKSLLSLPADQVNTLCMALNCIGCALNTVSPLDQVAQMLLDDGSELIRGSQLLQDLLDCTQPHMPSLARVEALQALKFAIHNYPSIKMPFWALISPIKYGILKMSTVQSLGGDPNIGSLHYPDEKVVHAATKLLNEFLRAVSGSSFTDDLQDEVLHQSLFAAQSTDLFSLTPVAGSHSTPEHETRNELFEVGCWDESLQDYLPLLLAHSSALVRAEAMTCFAGLTFSVFCALPEQKGSFIISTLLEMAVKDESPSVRSTACRAIGVLVNFPTLTSRTDVLTSAMDVIMHSTKDSSLAVRITASWALANFCDALRCASEKNNPGMYASLPFTALAECAMKLSKDSDKVRANAVRALGNLTRVINFDVEDASAMTLVAHNKKLLESKRVQPESPEKSAWLERVVQTFVSCVTTGNVKVQWNVCHALGNLFLNKSIGISEMTWATSVFSILLLLLRDSKNFKIRIQAAAALAVPETRRDYGESFCDVLQALVLALDSLNSSEAPIPSAFKYMHALSEQLSNTCLHVLGLAEHQDYEHLQDFLIKREAFLEGWVRSMFTVASQEDADGGCQCIENEGSEGTSSSHLARCWIHKEKLLMPPRERIWYALNEREPQMSSKESLSRRNEDVRRVAEKLIDMYTHGNQTKLVVAFEQLLMQCSS
eukprot:c10890_g1_i1 orf=147-3497(+)